MRNTFPKALGADNFVEVAKSRNPFPPEVEEQLKTIEARAEQPATDTAQIIANTRELLGDLIQVFNNPQIKAQADELLLRKAASGSGLRVSTAQFYPDSKPKGVSRQTLNDRSWEILQKFKNAYGQYSLTDEEKKTLASYTGCGGNLINPLTGNVGSAYEYYTPKPIAEGIWDVVKDLGFTGGKVLDPCAGAGIFGATSPTNCVVDAVELSEVSADVNRALNGGAGYSVTNSPFEKFATSTPDEDYDAVVTNVPFGGHDARGGLDQLDPGFEPDAPLDVYFILRSLKKLRPGGRAAFITPTRIMSGKQLSAVREKCCLAAEFIGAYRLPSGTFKDADTDVETDVIFFRKHSEETAEKIEELRTANKDVLIKSNILFQDFINGVYFKTSEGRPYVLGEESTRKDQFGHIEESVVYNGNILADFKDLLKKRRLPKSRINWKLLEISGEMPPDVKVGDVRFLDGAQYVMTENGMQLLNRTGGEQVKQMAAIFVNPMTAFEARATYEQADALASLAAQVGRLSVMPDWARGAYDAIRSLTTDDSRMRDLWNTALVAVTANYVVQENSKDIINYLERFPELSEKLKGINRGAEKDYGTTYLKGIVQQASWHYDKKKYTEHGFSDFWRGDVAKEVVKTKAVIDASMTDQAKIEALCGEKGESWLSVEDGKKALGDDFDPMKSDDFMVSADGARFCTINDYLVGNVGEKITELNKLAKEATTDELKTKFVRIAELALTRVEIPDISRLEFDLRNPLITAEEKVAFFSESGICEAELVASNDPDRPDVRVFTGNPKTNRQKYLRRLTAYIKSGNLTLGGVVLDDPEVTQKEGVVALRNTCIEVNRAFNTWVRSNDQIMARLKNIANDLTLKNFKIPDDESYLNIPGLKLKPDGTPAIKLHGYQSAYARKMGRSFSGINGFGTGLGKTFTALAAVQHAHAIGSKKKTLFVVPSATLTNWVKEARTIFDDTSDCLYIGVRADRTGKESVKSSLYAEDLFRIKENKHSKIFMTAQAFQAIRLKGETVDEYLANLKYSDAEYRGGVTAKGVSEADEQEAEARLSKVGKTLRNKKTAFPFLEELGIDSVVFDEAHQYKNSVNVYGMSGIKDLPISSAAAIALDAQAKSWYIRGQNKLGDGVLMLTATPVTNSPSEIYAMLSLAVGANKVNDLCLGCNGASDFVKCFAAIEDQDGENIAGKAENRPTFFGLDGLDVLKVAMKDIITIKTAQDVGQKVHVPQAPETATAVMLNREERAYLNECLDAYIWAKYGNTRAATEDSAVVQLLAEHPNAERSYENQRLNRYEPDEVMSHPFNYLNLVNKATLDVDLAKKLTRYIFPEEQIGIAHEVVDKFNKLKIQYQVQYPPVNEGRQKELGITRKKKGEDFEYFKAATAEVDAQKFEIVIDCRDYDAQEKFEDLAAKANLDLDVRISAKMAALIERFNSEMSNPRGGDLGGAVPSDIVKQIVFCDYLEAHHYVKRILSTRCGVPANKIAIISGKAASTPSDILDVQMGFNAQGEENQYQAVIGNKKAEVGINLQKGVQAIHHLTIDWTPDAIVQRNGRGARQGNKTQFVNIYFYDAEGTYDVLKRKLVNGKADWQKDLFNTTENRVQTASGSFTRAQLEQIITTGGDASKFEEISRKIEEENRQAKIAATRRKQFADFAITRRATGIKSFYSNGNKVKREFVGKAWDAFAAVKKAERAVSNAKDEKAKTKALTKLEFARGGFKKFEDKASGYALRRTSHGPEAGATTPTTLGEWFERVLKDKKGRSNAIKSADSLGYYSLTDVYPHELTLDFTPDSPVMLEAQEKVSRAERNIASAQQSLSEASKLEGAIPAEAFTEDSDWFINIQRGVAVKSGSLCKSGGHFYLLFKQDKNDFEVRRLAVIDGRTYYIYPEEFVPEHKWIMPGEAGYGQLAKKIAELEDGQLVKEGEEFSGRLISSECSYVASLREVKKLAKIKVENLRFESPLFPYWILSDNDNPPSLQRARKDHEALFERVYSRYGEIDSVLLKQDAQGVSVAEGEIDVVQYDLALSKFMLANGETCPAQCIYPSLVFPEIVRDAVRLAEKAGLLIINGTNVDCNKDGLKMIFDELKAKTGLRYRLRYMYRDIQENIKTILQGG